MTELTPEDFERARRTAKWLSEGVGDGCALTAATMMNLGASYLSLAARLEAAERKVEELQADNHELREKLADAKWDLTP